MNSNARVNSDNQRIVDNPNYQLVQIGSNRYNLRDAVKLPIDESENEWIAKNIFDFHKQICMLYGTIIADCNCPKMTAGKKYEYLWCHGPKREPVDCNAPKYIHHVLDWVQEQLDDEDVFPSCSLDKDFPPDFTNICQTIAKRLLRIYAHVYHHHLDKVNKLKEEAHMNTSLKHFIYFVQEFNLVTSSDLDPLKEFIGKFDHTDMHRLDN